MPLRPEWQMSISYIIAQLLLRGDYDELREQYKADLVGTPECGGAGGGVGGDRRRRVQAQTQAADLAGSARSASRLQPSASADFSPEERGGRFGDGAARREQRRRLKVGGKASAAEGGRSLAEADDGEEDLDGQPILDEMDLFAPLITTAICSTLGLLCFYCCGYSESCFVLALRAKPGTEHLDPDTMTHEELLKFIARKVKKMDDEMHGRSLHDSRWRDRDRDNLGGDGYAGGSGGSDGGGGVANRAMDVNPPWQGMIAGQVSPQYNADVDMDEMDNLSETAAAAGETLTPVSASVAASLRSPRRARGGGGDLGVTNTAPQRGGDEVPDLPLDSTDYFEKAALMQERLQKYAPNGGSLSLEQVALLSAELGFPLLTEQSFEEAIAVMDANADGDVDCAEFESWWKTKIAAKAKKAAAAANP